MAVSVVLNGARSNTRVSEATRQRILDVAADVNYSPNALARGLKRQRTNTLGILFNWAGSRILRDLYSVEVMGGITQEASNAHYLLLLYTERWRDDASDATTFSDRRTDGIIVVAPEEGSGVIPGLVALGVPSVLVSSAKAVSGVPYVTIDNRRGVTLALEHLTALGHTRIAYAGQGLSRFSFRERHEAFRAWMKEHGRTVPESHVLAGMQTGGSGRNAAALEALLRAPDRPTAVFASNDDLAAEIMDSARAVGLSVPEDLSVVGFDDVLTASLTVPKLTTIRQPLVEMGAQAARLLIKRIEGEPITEQAHVYAPELIVRGSSAPPVT
ncbi:MAG: LacI family DNA-binding transcriptional regulator [Armatimonadaceae bacterium]